MKLRFDVVEVTGMLLLAVVAAVVLQTPMRAPVRAPHMIEGDLIASVKKRFGAGIYSQGPEEWLIRDFFDDRRNGVFLDVGSFHPVNFSNTYRLEHDLGWTGIAVDAIKEFAPLYAGQRPGTRFFVAFVGETDSGEATLHLDPEQALVASGDASFTREFTGKARPVQVRRRTLDSILREAGVTTIDFVSLDIELGEPAALRGFTLSEHRPRLLCIEAHAKTRQAILNIMAEAGYVVVGRYLRIDTANLYFTPLPRPAG